MVRIGCVSGSTSLRTVRCIGRFGTALLILPRADERFGSSTDICAESIRDAELLVAVPVVGVGQLLVNSYFGDATLDSFADYRITRGLVAEWGRPASTVREMLWNRSRSRWMPIDFNCRMIGRRKGSGVGVIRADGRVVFGLDVGLERIIHDCSVRQSLSGVIRRGRGSRPKQVCC